jgi:hypothetical protein
MTGAPPRRDRRSAIRLLVLLSAAASALALCPVAGAATTFGSSLSVSPEHSLCGSGTFTNTALAGSLTAPFSGAIVRWRMDLAESGGANSYKLRVLRPAGGSSYTAVGSGPAQTAPFAGINVLTLPTPLSVQAGDIIAIDCPSGAPLPTTDHGLAGSTYAFFNPVLGEGKTASTTNQLPGEEMLIDADVVGMPSVASISSASGPASGGTVVSLAGSHLGEVSAVSFGGVPASFTLVSESQLFAVAPPGSGTVSVSVTNAAGSATAPQQFAYLAAATQGSATAASGTPKAGGGNPGHGRSCVVPKLEGKKLKAARKALKSADCKLGRVTKLKAATTKSGLVVSQNPQSGKKLAAGAKIAVKLAPPHGS